MALSKTAFTTSDLLKRMGQLIEDLDETNVSIISAMRALGPRNLLDVARKTGIPFPTVYSRVHGLEKKLGALTRALPCYSKLGLVRCEALVQANAGMEAMVTEALKLPKYWSMVTRSEGQFSHFSIHAVPYASFSLFKRYLGELRELGIVRRYAVFKTGEYYPFLPVFESYDPRNGRWSFDWPRWLKAVTEGKITAKLEDSKGYKNFADKKDILILRELEKDARRKLSQIAKVVGMTLQAVKYRFDRKMTQRGLIQGFIFSILPYPSGIADLREVKLDFSSEESMNRFFSNAKKLFFIWGISKIVGRNSLLVRTYVPSSEATNLFAFLSELARRGAVTEYSTLKIIFEDAERQTLPYELFDEKRGWVFDFRGLRESLKSLMTVYHLARS